VRAAPAGAATLGLTNVLSNPADMGGCLAGLMKGERCECMGLSCWRAFLSDPGRCEPFPELDWLQAARGWLAAVPRDQGHWVY